MLSVIYQLGLIKYVEAYRLQKKLLRQRLDGEISDVLLLLQHPPTLTIGKSGKLENVLASGKRLSEEGISLFFVDRGGDVTYHGPGQLVGYPIIDLRGRGRDVHKYIRDLEEVILRTFSSFSIIARKDGKHPGIMVKEEMVAFIGLSVRRWISMHGFAINVNPKLENFLLINPCGFSKRKTTSICRLLSQDVSIETVTRRLVDNFAEVFSAQVEWGSDLLASTYL